MKHPSFSQQIDPYIREKRPSCEHRQILWSVTKGSLQGAVFALVVFSMALGLGIVTP